MMTKQEFVNAMLEKIKQGDIDDEVTSRDMRAVSKFTSTIYKLKSGEDVTGKFVEDLVEDASNSYIYALLMWREYSKGKGKAALDKYNFKIEEMECFKENFEEIYDYAQELDLETDKQLGDFTQAALFIGRKNWQKTDMLSQFFTLTKIATDYIEDEVKGDKNNDGDDKENS